MPALTWSIGRSIRPKRGCATVGLKAPGFCGELDEDALMRLPMFSAAASRAGGGGRTSALGRRLRYGRRTDRLDNLWREPKAHIFRHHFDLFHGPVTLTL